MSSQESPPTLMIGGQENALCVARSLGEKGISVYVTASEDCFAYKSRYCKKSYPVPIGRSDIDYWHELLLADQPDELKGCVIMVGSDLAIEFVSINKAELSKYYILDDFDPEIQIAMLDKQKILEWGKKSGCPVPAFWNIDSLSDVDVILSDMVYPVMIKPIHSHLFQKRFAGKKYLLAEDEGELLINVKAVLAKGLRLMVTEMIPGPDDLQSSYHTYIDKTGKHLFHYTHKINRRYPKNSGGGCLHTTAWLPKTAAMGQKFFQGINFRGMGHVEFKYDQRDNRLKIIECNPRFSAALAISVKSGMDMPYLVYCHMTGKPHSADKTYLYNVKRWMVLADLLALRQLLKLGEITFSQWFKSLLGTGLVFAYFKLSDPMPFVSKFYSDVSSIIRQRLKRSRND